MYQTGSKYFCSDIDEMSCRLSGEAGDITKNNLSHRKIWTDIKHVDESPGMNNYIQICGNTCKK